jgi:hypothetical protein
MGLHESKAGYVAIKNSGCVDLGVISMLAGVIIEHEVIVRDRSQQYQHVRL